MYTKQDYERMLEEGFWAMYNEAGWTRLEYLSEFIFNFDLYDDEMAEKFANKAIEVCEAISNKTTFDYIKNPMGYTWYLVMVNMPFFADKLNWGTSIRGAWWETPFPDRKIKYTSYGLFLDGVQLCDPIEFTTEQWCEFIEAVIEFRQRAAGE